MTKRFLQTPYIYLFGIVVIGALLRIANISAFKVYPDSYQSLVVAKNITTYHSVVGYLGNEGLSYPEFFMWTRSIYPLLIDLFSPLFAGNLTLAAKVIAYSAGVCAIPAAFLFINQVFKNKWYGLTASLVMALSFYHTVWTGYIMTEPIGVLYMLLFLTSLFANLNKKAEIADIKDFLTGTLFALCVLARYEYTIIIPAVVLIVFLTSPQSLKRLLNIITAVFFVITLVVSLLFPWQFVMYSVINQLQDLLQKAGIVAAIFLLIAVVIFFLPKRYMHQVIQKGSVVTIAVIWLFALLLLVQLFGNHVNDVLFDHLFFIREFVRYDYAIALFSLIGITILLLSNKLQAFAFFVIAATLPLAVLYHQINPSMDRYATHLIPFFLIPASYGLVFEVSKILELFRKNNTAKIRGGLLVIAIGVLLLFQTFTTLQGLRQRTDQSWFTTSYEEQAAKMVKPYIAKDTMLLVSFPDSYYYLTNTPTQSIADKYPYIYFTNVPNNQKLLIVDDMGMSEIFPHFTNLVEHRLKGSEKAQFYLHKQYHFSNRSKKETHPVIVYETTLEQLKQVIAKKGR